MAERFTSMAQVHAHRERLRAERDAHARAMEEHWTALREPAIRQAMVGGVVKGVLRSLFTWRAARDAAEGAAPGVLGAALGAAIGGPGKGPFRQAIAAGLSAAIPLLWERWFEEGKAGHVLSELDRSWERVKEHVRERRRARQGNGDEQA